MKSDTIKALNEVVSLAGQRGEKIDVDPNAEQLYELIEKIVAVAGDCLEDHVKASNRAKPRKERVNREIVRRIAAYFCDGCDTVEAAQHTEEGVREILASFDVETVDYTGRPVKIV